jgi:hypothetical protein
VRNNLALDRRPGTAWNLLKRPVGFPAYFRYELPEAIFSSVQMAVFIQQFDRASSQAAREALFSNTLQSMEKGTLKRDDFLRKLVAVVKTMQRSTAMFLGQAAVKESDQYAYDTFPSFGEAGHVLRIVHNIAQKLLHPERVSFLPDRSSRPANPV